MIEADLAPPQARRGSVAPTPVRAARAARGARNALGGRAAESAVARHYQDRGLPVATTRWRGAAGEIDLVARDGDGLIFVEVKQGRDFDRAAEHLSGRQIGRICAAASEYLARMPLGQLTNVRFDLALVDGQGRIEIRENAFMA